MINSNKVSREFTMCAKHMVTVISGAVISLTLKLVNSLLHTALRQIACQCFLHPHNVKVICCANRLLIDQLIDSRSEFSYTPASWLSILAPARSGRSLSEDAVFISESTALGA